ncbi:MAG TPA: hypothetical protein VEI28_01625 [Thermodesulfovibrionales bacterium]|nr:hypothetical protein [Thermodesulfovibrionales bacterium]
MKKNFVVLLAAVALVAGLVIGAWAERQPHMRAALEHLQKARVQLEKAEHDKGGHRANALALVERAISEVQQGIAFDRK